MDEVGKQADILLNKPIVNSEMTPQSVVPDRSPETQHESTFRLTLRFEKHHVKPEDYTRQQDELYRRLKETFKKGEANIFFKEDERETKYGNDKHRFVENFNKGFTKYHSFLTAYVYALPTSPRTDEDARRMIEGIKKDSSSSSRTYRIMTYEALDRLLAEGYDIQIMFEHGYPEVVSQQPKTLDDVKQEVMQDIERGINRERIIVNQITSLNDSPDMKQAVNLFVLLGTFHSSLVKLLPEELRDNIVASSENSRDEIFHSGARIVEKLRAGKDVSEEEWKELGKQWPGVEGIE